MTTPIETRQLPRLGLHTGIAGGLHRSIERAMAAGCQTWQIFSRNPRGWSARPIDLEAIRLFREARQSSSLDPCVIHSCYLINLAAPNGDVRLKSIAAFRDEVERCLAIGADYLVVHPGSAREMDSSVAIANCVTALHQAVSGIETTMVRDDFHILIENTAGQGGQIGRTFEEVSEILNRCPDLPIGMCLDTAHSFAAGYDWRDEEASQRAFRELEQTVGIGRVRVVHFNDSKSAFGSHVDRHWHIGVGEIGGEGLARVLNHPELVGRPFILETPQDQPGDDQRNLLAARSLLTAG
ncbi:MAG: deoxyribonuclease IV [Acidobacteria bacterium]|nr:deoxyribonuclease IV [Acidobacteriota bacterium]